MHRPAAASAGGGHSGTQQVAQGLVVNFEIRHAKQIFAVAGVLALLDEAEAVVHGERQETGHRRLSRGAHADALHRVRLAGPRLPVTQHAAVVSFHGRAHDRPHLLLVNLLRPAQRAVDRIERVGAPPVSHGVLELVGVFYRGAVVVPRTLPHTRHARVLRRAVSDEKRPDPDAHLDVGTVHRVRKSRHRENGQSRGDGR
mmetsp:Transcript_517/g.1216  ORF Transcript_517/g.1216 Transcript_517/m.1216 type:complete len:200 (+) Transcript_517:2377-2976(+)